MDEKQYLLRMESISKDFFGNQVLKDVTLRVGKGEIIGLVGENGAGKSTLMNILFGLSVIHETGGFQGKIFLEDNEVNFASPFEAIEAGIGMVHQEFILIPGFTATENILLNRESTNYNIFVEVFGERLRTLDREEMHKRAVTAIEKLEVQLDPDMLVSEMPVGHRQFTEIAREMDRKSTKLLVLDEPTAVLTESEADTMLKAARKLADLGLSIIFITHRLSEVLEIADRLIVLRDGQVVRELESSKTTPREVASLMVGREIKDASSVRSKDSEESEIVLDIKDLWVDMPGEQVNGVNLQVHKGEILGIGGLAGQGKLGISNGVMGLFPAEGEVHYKGEILPLNNPVSVLSKGIAFVSEDRRGVGLLLDEPIDLNIVFTAMQIQGRFIKNFLGGLVKWRDEKEISRVAREYVDSLQIKCVSEKQEAKELSGGNQQKVCLAKAFVLEPDLLFVSEPTRGIDVGAKSVVLETLRRQNREHGTTIIMTSSELEELRSICDRIAIVSEGKIFGILPPTADPADFGLLMLGEQEEVKSGV
ncbi:MULTISPECIES: sugar ABC transporter ATP-binding protein [unclassified Mesotoga]|jgi:simple sugar transport system ATP-binding protein|uniref:sugar ABC transporter ATP-binding protein n=1 Tax=unclassified Mesotoga TaxID=1184398 RepID=UPI000EF275E3|nr:MULTISPECIES: sugar ABC transporter ATP-binding protein [unclassified Mesotoga]MDI9368611.1 sugar ABC transporter ATP-binding protein [Thermotogota bacterium]MDD3681389.1 sugar ABC transporter ATP-binding protein [Mesotoga sp.]MDD4208243.1 sugar ABC transporter ATP-binding protein [Mesotoga sp.]MDD4826002.1 sugar ABC transporter ATP-binding protein [Mesotoga sp.]MDD5683395.1 sugar ABC transporter ATP-binding protein [Mesotoga sp.]